MATTDDKKLISLANLKQAVNTLKTYIDGKDAKSYKNILLNSKDDTIYFFKAETVPTVLVEGVATPDWSKADYSVKIASSDIADIKALLGDATLTTTAQTITGAINELDADITTINGDDQTPGSTNYKIKTVIDGINTTTDVAIASEADNVVTIKAGVKQEKGEITQGTGTDIVLAKVAKTGAAIDVSVANADGKFTATTVEGVLAELQGNIEEASEDIDDLKEELIGKATDVKTADTIYGAKAFATDAVTTLDNSLADVAKSGNASDVTVSDTKITATTVAGALTEIVSKANANTAAITKLNGAVTEEGSVAKAIDDKVKTLDTTSDVVIASKDTSTGKVTLKAGVKEENGIIAQGTGADIELGTAANADVATDAIAAESTDANLVSAAQVATFVKGQIKGLSGAMHFIGVATPTEGQTDIQAIQALYAEGETPKAGDFAVISTNGLEYVFNGTNWVKLGDELTYVTKSTTIAGVDLEDNITKNELLTALNVKDGAQVNVIEEIQLGGVKIDPVNKVVNFEIATEDDINALFPESN